MKPEPAPSVPGNTEAERMSNALRMVLTVPRSFRKEPVGMTRKRSESATPEDQQPCLAICSSRLRRASPTRCAPLR